MPTKGESDREWGEDGDGAPMRDKTSTRQATDPRVKSAFKVDAKSKVAKENTRPARWEIIWEESGKSERSQRASRIQGVNDPS